VREDSRPATIDVPPSSTLPGAVFDNARRIPGTVVFSRTVGGSWAPVTSREFAGEVEKIYAR
jgi:long-chain acyl-CoA synthetase